GPPTTEVERGRNSGLARGKKKPAEPAPEAGGGSKDVFGFVAADAPPRREAYEVRCFACPARVMVNENPPEFLPVCDKCR
ncbi:hypothetical protein WFJ45_23045, partial [Salmonella enterica subsp. enterica serovar Minnesota]|uniref:hypothetical protein n=1 Tax=Salmonella enterica TaxID=28901 RepID=UPI003D2D7500